MRNYVMTFFLIGLCCIPNSKAQESPFQAALAAQFDGYFTEDAPGGVFLIQQKGETVFLKSYGLADMDTKVKLDENSILNTGSISKTFVANGILILAEEGKLRLEDPISNYFDDFEYPEIIQDITIKHLLSNSSGLPDLRKVSEDPAFYMTAKDTANFEPIKGVTALNFMAGAKFQYSNPAYNGLALIIEKVSGQKWQDFVAERIFIPAGMTGSTITDGAHPQTGVAHAYEARKGGYLESDYGETPTFAAAGNGGVWSSVLELAKYETALQQHVFLGEESLRASRTVYRDANWSASAQPFVGYGWFLGETSLLGRNAELGVDVVYHTGSQGGFRSFFISIPEKELVYVALFNRPVPEMRKMMRTGLELLKAHDWLAD
ncbi:beta-lactamase family protein [Maribacter sp.]|nr:beta-lactamase family protein [Maribacter sp.]